LITIASAPISAQITTTITQPKKTPAVQAAEARREAAAQDSVARTTLTDMKVWVDSAAAALAVRPDTAGAPNEATIAPEPPAARADSAPAPQRAAQEQPEFREGARAPDTATNIPSLALTGAALIVAGIFLRRRAARVPATRR
jgi:hypothetical protein